MPLASPPSFCHRLGRELHDAQRIAVGVAKTEHGRHPRPARDLVVNVDAPGLQVVVVCLRIGGGKADAGVYADAPLPEGARATVVAAPGGATSIQRWPWPNVASSRVSKPSLPA